VKKSKKVLKKKERVAGWRADHWAGYGEKFSREFGIASFLTFLFELCARRESGVSEKCFASVVRLERVDGR
jgi:hypothetical protein